MAQQSTCECTDPVRRQLIVQRPARRHIHQNENVCRCRSSDSALELVLTEAVGGAVEGRLRHDDQVLAGGVALPAEAVAGVCHGPHSRPRRSSSVVALALMLVLARALALVLVLAWAPLSAAAAAARSPGAVARVDVAVAAAAARAAGVRHLLRQHRVAGVRQLLLLGALAGGEYVPLEAAAAARALNLAFVFTGGAVYDTPQAQETAWGTPTLAIALALAVAVVGNGVLVQN